MARARILTDDDRVELIDGEIVEPPPVGQRHAACVAQLVRQLGRAAGERVLVWPRNPLRLPRDTELSPDVALLRPRRDDYFRHPARPEDVLLLVEVADVSYRYDRRVKLPLYARAGIPETWIVDLTYDVFEVHRDPGPRGYASAHPAARADTVTSLAIPGLALAVIDVLPPASPTR